MYHLYKWEKRIFIQKEEEIKVILPFCHIEPYRNNNNRQKCAFRYALENLLRILTHNSGSIQNHLLSEFFKSKKAPYHYSKKLQMAYIKNLT